MIVNCKISIFILLCPLCILFACSKKTDEPDAHYAKTSPVVVGTMDSTLDDYPVTDSMLRYSLIERNGIPEEINGISSSGYWFVDETKSETLVFDLFTDYHRMYTYHFLNSEDMPQEIKGALFIEVEDTVRQDKEINAHIHDFIGAAKKIDKRYFTSIKGRRLGDTKEKVLQSLGTPSNCLINNDVEKCIWEIDSTNRTVLYFKKNKLIAVAIYRNLL